MTLPWRSPKTWNSIWRGALTYFSISTRASPKADLRLAHAGGERVVEIGVALDPAHALAAAAGHRLDQHRIADLVGLALEEGRHPACRRDSPAPPARPPLPSAPWRGPSAPWRGWRAGDGPMKTMPASRAGFARSRRSPTGSRSRDGCSRRPLRLRGRDQLVDRRDSFPPPAPGRWRSLRRPA